MSAQGFDTVDVLRLEVAGDPEPGGVPNLIRNYDGTLGGWGWLSPVDNSTVTADEVTPGAFYGLRISTAATQALHVTSEFLPVDAAATHIKAAIRRLFGTVNSGVRAQVVFYDASLTQIGATPQTSLVTADNTTATLAATAVTAGTAYAKLRVDVYRSGGNPTAGDSVTIDNAALVAGTSTELAGTTTLDDGWVDVLGPTHEIVVERAELNLGTLTATILDSALDPSQAETIRTGKRCRLTADINPGSPDSGTPDWQEVFTGTVLKATVAYDLLNSDPVKRARIQLSAVDQAQPLGNTKRPEGVALIDDLPYVFEGAGVPWNVNGNTGHTPTTPPVVAANDNAYAIDQVAITRDSNLGYAWFDRRGVVQVWDANLIDPTIVGTLDDTVYNPGIVVDFDTDRCINFVSIKYLRPDPATGETIEVDYGPYLDRASIAKWGTHSAEFTVQGIDDDEPTMAAYAAVILAANATPVVRVNEVTVPINTRADVIAWGMRDLYDRVTLTPPTAAP